jgi:pimeloyl-ACP methyl ester carboxylesterase
MVDGDRVDDRLVELPGRGVRLHVRERRGTGRPLVLLHGLASNALTWEPLARLLNAAGHHVVSVDQRGHGHSDKPDHGYGFDEVTADLAALLDELALSAAPILAGQSWGGNVVLDFAARYPGRASGVVLVDGGFSEMSARPGATWEQISVDLKPPSTAGVPRDRLAAWMRKNHPDWTDEGIEDSLGNFETLPDGTVRVWLSLEHHMEILRALWEHHPTQLFPKVDVPVLIAAAGGGDPARMEMKRAALARAEQALPRSRVLWFAGADHDIHVHRPNALAEFILGAFADGFLPE